jgi:hypothetical protein
VQGYGVVQEYGFYGSMAFAIGVCGEHHMG